MKAIIIKHITGLVVMASLVMACTNSLSLQQFIIDTQEKPDIISFNLSSTLLALNDEMQTPENIETLQSIKKANILAFQLNDSNKNSYTADKEHIKSILNQKKYIELMRFGKGSKGAKAYMIGNEDTINELIIFANDNKVGWLLVRVIGDNMKPEKIIQLLNKINFDTKNIDLSPLQNILGKDDGKE